MAGKPCLNGAQRQGLEEPKSWSINHKVWYARTARLNLPSSWKILSFMRK